jgi:hypothetical protein
MFKVVNRPPKGMGTLATKPNVYITGIDIKRIVSVRKLHLYRNRFDLFYQCKNNPRFLFS